MAGTVGEMIEVGEVIEVGVVKAGSIVSDDDADVLRMPVLVLVVSGVGVGGVGTPAAGIMSRSTRPSK